MPRSLREVQSFMDKERLASFATADPNNQPHVVPVFFTYEDGKVYVQTDRDSVKVRNLSRNSNVAVAVYREEEAVVIRGNGQVMDSDEEFIRRTQDHIDKYGLRLDEHGRDSLGIPLFDKKVRCVVEITPKRIMFW
jgi:nitroimidazol reductase NimA-like FMN-containing flavoprotein (pyridoxamine 5'-phosphate oxidase superfamily)